ncbi:MAG: helix-turn-helix transcriptional regulator [Pseudobutyrivibrio sp.]|nr:helix-turn-helix transcriptional regulator [Pseudobutyrivibrio sp.]
MRTNSTKELEQALLSQSENGIFHAAYSKELRFYGAVQKGDMDTVLELYTPLDTLDKGVLSPNPVRNYRYHLIVSTALITRFCLEGGLPTETAYTLSDLYINKADTATSVDQLTVIHKEMIEDFTNRMYQMKKSNVMSMPVANAVNYIHKNIRAPITEADIARELGINASYLSSLFKKELGLGIKAYITNVRVDIAKNMLQFSNYSYSDISNYLCFNSHSYFISVFKKQTGITPKQYRTNYFQSNWKDSEEL